MSFKLLQVKASLPPGGEDRPEMACDFVSVADDAVKAIEGLPKRPLNLITIWGPARTGKSFFINNLARSDDLFPVCGEATPCTVGADMSATTCEASWVLHGMTQQQGESPATSSPVVGFVDVEGSGDKHVDYDILLATPLLLLSKVVFFNWKGRPAKTVILESLARMAETASAIAKEKRTDTFGHLVILLRDTPSKEEEARRIILDPEEPDGSFESEEAISSRIGRNETRERLMEAFRSVKVVCLPKPHGEINASRIGHEEVKDKFKAKLDQVREHVRGILYEPHLVGEHSVEGGVMFASLLEEVCAAVNRRNKDIVPIRMMETVIRREVEKCRTEGIEHFEAKMRTLEGSPSSSLAALTTAIEGCRNDAFEEFREKTKGRGETIVRALEVKLEEKLLQLSEGCRVRREQKIASAKTRVSAIVSAAGQEMDDQTQKIIEKIPVGEDAELRIMWENASRSVYAKMENEVQASFSEGLRADLGSSFPSWLVFQKNNEGEIENLMNMNRGIREEKEKHAAEMKEEEKRQMQMRRQHEKEQKIENERLQAEREEQRRQRETMQNEINHLRHRIDVHQQQENQDFFQNLGQFFEGMFTGHRW